LRLPQYTMDVLHPGGRIGDQIPVVGNHFPRSSGVVFGIR
jgi:hypothetical protein